MPKRFGCFGMEVCIYSITYRQITSKLYSMRKPYIHPEASELELGCLYALAESPAQSDSSLEGFDNNFSTFEW